MWRSLPERGYTSDSDFEVPMLKWLQFGHWARVMAALLGDDAEIIAKPTAPIDENLVKKVGIYMTWRLFEYMKATPQLTAWVFRSILFGTGHAYCPYEMDEHVEYDGSGKLIDVQDYDGPKLEALWPSEIVLPAQVGVHKVSEFDWKIRRIMGVTPQQLIDGEDSGIYSSAVTENWEQIIAFAEQRQERDYWYDDEQIDADQAEGVSHASLLGQRASIEVWQWYGKWRLPKSGLDVRENNLKWRNRDESELLVSYLPKLNLIIGVQDLRRLYPRSKKRDPFLDIHLVQDGSYWGPGMGEIVEQLQNKSSANYRLFERAGKLSVGPVIFYKPSAGNFDPDVFVYDPGTAVPSEDPSSINVVSLKADSSFSEQNSQALQGFAEKTTGVSDQTLGQSIDRPNAPRTAAGQMALIEQGNVRASLDMSMIQDSLSEAVEWIWQLDREFTDESVFFRVTGDDADGVFDAPLGFGTMTAEERNHQFDFQVKFANSVWSKEAKKAQTLQICQEAMASPLVQQNPRAMWMIMDKLWKSQGDSSFSEIIPAPPDLDEPRTPKDEWSRALRGEDIAVNPLDDDRIHLIDHQRRLADEQALPEEERDRRAESMIIQNIMEHHQQMRQKQLLAALAQRIQMQLQNQQATIAQGPVAPPNPLPIPGQQPQPQQGQPQQQGGPAAAAAIAGPAGIGGVQ